MSQTEVNPSGFSVEIVDNIYSVTLGNLLHFGGLKLA